MTGRFGVLPCFCQSSGMLIGTQVLRYAQHDKDLGFW